jgi:hypothetical protein
MSNLIILKGNISIAKKHLKTYYFPLKSQKHTILAGQGGVKGPLLPSPADAHGLKYIFKMLA